MSEALISTGRTRPHIDGPRQRRVSARCTRGTSTVFPSDRLRKTLDLDGCYPFRVGVCSRVLRAQTAQTEALGQASRSPRAQLPGCRVHGVLPRGRVPHLERAAWV